MQHCQIVWLRVIGRSCSSSFHSQIDTFLVNLSRLGEIRASSGFPESAPPVRNMENAEEIMHSLEEFSKMKPKDIPHELDDYLGYVARTGDPVFKWSIIKCLFREKLLNVITDFYESTLTIELPPCPNVDAFNYERMKANLLEKLDSFHGAPFTVQRISELLTNPRKEYNRADKFMRAIEKNILVVSTREPGREAEAESYNGMPDANDSGVETGFPCNDFSDPDSTAHNYEVKSEQVDPAYHIPDAVEGSSGMSDDGTSGPVVQEMHELPVTVAEVKDPESVICSTSASEQSQSQPSESADVLVTETGDSGDARQESPVASTSETPYDLGSAPVEPSPSTSSAEPSGFPDDSPGFVEEPPVHSTPAEDPALAVVQISAYETAPTATLAEEVSTSDVGSSGEPVAPVNPPGEEDMSAEAVPLSSEVPEPDLQCAEAVTFEDDRPSQSESATSQSDSAACQSDFLSQSESSGSDSNPSVEEPGPSESASTQVEEVQQPQEEPLEVKVVFEAEPSVPSVPPVLEVDGGTDGLATSEAEATSCEQPEQPQTTEPTKDRSEAEVEPEPEQPERQPEPEPKPVIDGGDLPRETSVIHTTSSDVDEPMEVDECQIPEQKPLPEYPTLQ